MLQRDDASSGLQRLVFRDKDRAWIYIPLILIGAILGYLSIGRADLQASDTFKIVNNYLVGSIVLLTLGIYIATKRELVFDKALGQLLKSSSIMFFRFSKVIDLRPMTQVATVPCGNPDDVQRYKVVLRGAVEEYHVCELGDPQEAREFARHVAQFVGLEAITWEDELFQKLEDQGPTRLHPWLQIIEHFDGRQGWESYIDKYGRLIFQQKFGTHLRSLGSVFVFVALLALLSFVFGGVQANPSAKMVVPVTLLFGVVGLVLWRGWQSIVFDKAKGEVYFCWGVYIPLVRIRRATTQFSEVVIAWRPEASGEHACLQSEILLRGDHGLRLSICDSLRGEEQKSMADRISKYLDWPLEEKRASG